jgi:uncharacterized protein YkwD
MLSITRRLRARRGALAVLAVALAVLGAACVPPTASAPRPAAPSAGPADDIVNRHNAARAGAGLPGFAIDGALNTNAQYHAQRLASSSDGSCRLWHSGELPSWYPGRAAAENVACIGPCPSNGAQMMSMWLNSPEHSVNIFNGGYRYIGVGVACNGREGFAVVHFRS